MSPEKILRQVFISHHSGSEDAALAHQLASDLRQRGWSVWIAPESIHPGEKWVDAISRGLEESNVVVLVLTPEAINSEWVKTEVALAIEQAHIGKVRFIPMEVKPSWDAVPSMWRAYQRISFMRGYGGALDELLAVLAREEEQPIQSQEVSNTRSGSNEEIRKDSKIWEKDGKEMVRVSEGDFLFGVNKQKVHLPEFWIDKSPVTNAEYLHFLKVTGRKLPPLWKEITPPINIASHPVVRVTWDDALAYAEWAGKQLPIEEEWEKAARGTDGREYPWGNQDPTLQFCNFNNKTGGTTPVGSYSPQGDSPYGCVDMSGNVREWTDSWYDEDKDSIPVKRRVQRGGSFDDVDGRRLSCWFRLMSPPFYGYPYYGFRLLVRH